MNAQLRPNCDVYSIAHVKLRGARCAAYRVCSWALWQLASSNQPLEPPFPTWHLIIPHSIMHTRAWS